METDLRAAVALLDADSLDDQAALDAVDVFDRIERLAAAGKALAAARVARSDLWRGHGSRDAIGFLAKRTDSAYARVRGGLSVAEHLGELAQMDDVFRGGKLTIDQAADIAAAASEHPERETELVSLARTATRRQLKARCVEILAQDEGAEDQHRRAQAERSMSANVGRDGIWRGSIRLPIIYGAYVDKALDYFQTQIFDDARRQCDREPFDAYRADALVALARTAMGEDNQCHCVDSTGERETTPDGSGGNQASDPEATGTGSGLPGACVETSGSELGDSGCEFTGSTGREETSRPGRSRRRRRSSSIRHAIVINVPHTTFLTGKPTPGETCHVPGVGPVPVSVVHRLLEEDPIIKAIVTKGRDITAVATLTRSVKEDLRLAVLAANDLSCAVPDCDNRRFLELDHEIEYHKGGPTSYDNLRPLCAFHHGQRTDDGYEPARHPRSVRVAGSQRQHPRRRAISCS